MPLYEYRCRGCGHGFEALVRGSDKPACPSCTGQDLQQLPSTFAASSESTRQSNLKAARNKHAKISRDKSIAEQKQLQDHHH